MVLDYRTLPKLRFSNKIPANSHDHQIIKTKDIIHFQFDQHATQLQALYINIKWKLQDNQSGYTIQDLADLNITNQLMNNGLLFIWSEKQYIGQIIDVLESKNFYYVENLAVVLISYPKVLQQGQLIVQPKSKKITDFFKKKNGTINSSDKQPDQLKPDDVNALPDIEPMDVLLNEDYDFFAKGKRVLLMFRKIAQGQQLELRHQRTGDIFFDLIQEKDSQKLSDLGYEYIYQMIETLLPKALYKENENLKMMEIFADSETKGRQGWIQVVQE